MLALVVGAVGSTLIAVLTGLCYGLHRWRAIAAFIVSDALLRGAFIAVALALNTGVVGLAWAIAAPFAVVFAVACVVVAPAAHRDLALDADSRRLARNSLSTVGAAIAAALMGSGLPLVLGVTSSRTDPALLASLILGITLLRAPLMIPLLAMQSYLIVTFRDAPAVVAARLVRWIAALLGATGVLAVAAALLGPAVLDWLYRGRYHLDAAECALILVSAGLTAVLFLTGPAVLARSAHGWYAAGWAAASAAMIGMLVLPVADPARILVAICAAPVVGIIVHVSALMRKDA